MENGNARRRYLRVGKDSSWESADLAPADRHHHAVLAPDLHEILLSTTDPGDVPWESSSAHITSYMSGSRTHIDNFTVPPAPGAYLAGQRRRENRASEAYRYSMYIGLLVCLVHRPGESYCTRRAKPRIEWLYGYTPVCCNNKVGRMVTSRGGLGEARSAAQIACLPSSRRPPLLRN